VNRIDFGKLRDGMVDRQVASRGVRSHLVLSAMRRVPREGNPSMIAPIERHPNVHNSVRRGVVLDDDELTAGRANRTEKRAPEETERNGSR
jgi:hypothetical protein